ncbi:MAG: hypothetical protein AB1796_14635 [Bacillota bacterium]
MGKNKALIIAVSVLITALIVGAATYFVHVQRIAGLQQQVETLERTNAKLQSTNEELREQVAALQKQAANGPGEEGKDDVRGLVISRTPRPGWQTYFPDAENTTLLNEPVDRVRKLLGEPPFLIRSIAANPEFNREIWIYMAGEEDPTGLYLFFKANRLVQSRLDEFNGLYNSGLLEYPGFWLN